MSWFSRARPALLGVLTLTLIVGLFDALHPRDLPILSGGRTTVTSLPSAIVIPAGPTVPASLRASQQLLLTFASPPPPSETLAADLRVLPEQVQVNELARVATVVVNSEEERARVNETARELHRIVAVEADEPLQISTTPNDPDYGAQATHLGQIRAPSAWDFVQGKSTGTIAVIDTGVDGTHEDLRSKVLAGTNTITDATFAAGTDSDDHGHGTSVAGVAAAAGNNGVGIAGVDWRAKILPIKAFDSSGSATTSDVVEAITYAAGQGANVISMSFGRSTESAALTSAIDSAWSLGIVLAAAAGNENGAVSFPAANSHVIAVGSVGTSEVRSSFSNKGPELDLVAPGESIYTAKDGGGYREVSGTSLATPFVAGAVMVAKDFHSSARADEIVSILAASARTLGAMGTSGRTDEYGEGMLDLAQAVSGAGNYEAAAVTWSSSAGPITHPSIDPGQAGTELSITVRNTGRTRWFREIVHLGTSRVRDRISSLLRESGSGSPSGWLSPNRVQMAESSVAPGETATFTFWLQAGSGSAPGVYEEHFELVADGTGWFGPDIWWRITVRTSLERHRAAAVSWASSDGATTYPTLTRGSTGKQLSITVRNTGSATWQRGIVNLGTSSGRDRIPRFIREPLIAGVDSGWLSANRITMIEASVAPGETATFSFWLAVPADLPTGTYRESFELVADGVGWFGPDIWWTVTVQ